VGKRAKSPAKPKREKVRDVYVARPFEDLVDECEWIALRELVPAASAPLTLAPKLIEEYGSHQVILSTVLPMAWPAMTKPDGRVFIGLQRHVQSGDPSRDVAAALVCALGTPPGETVSVPGVPGPGPRLPDVLADHLLDITLHDGFDYWIDDQARDDAEVRASLERANASVYPTVRMSAARAAYWCEVPDRAHVRWVLPYDEEPALNAMARLAAADSLRLGEQTKFAGMFRALGRLVPVWDLPKEAPATQWEDPLAAFQKRLTEALDGGELTPSERRARQGLIGRQITLR
jgi:Family of unknown function (DUF5926)